MVRLKNQGKKKRVINQGSSDLSMFSSGIFLRFQQQCSLMVANLIMVPTVEHEELAVVCEKNSTC